jgi:hypothetical protein
VRRVVTGNDADGRGVFVSDGEPERLAAESIPPGIALVWGWDATPDVPTDGVKPQYRRFFPPSGGLRAIVLEIVPDSARVEISPDDDEWVGLFTDAEWDPDNPGMHRTNSIDIGLVLDGSLILELDDGAKTELNPGDWFVQNGTRHAWHNPHEQPCRLAIFLWGAEGPPIASAGT